MKKLKKLLYTQRKKLTEFKNMIKNITQDILYIKDISKKAKSIAFHLVLSYFSNN